MIHEQLMTDCLLLGQMELCHVLLMNDSQYPWFILVPDREGITEIYQLDKHDQQQLMTESSYLGECVMREFKGDKLNVAALGNVVPQLHVHHVVRYVQDRVWPAPVWGKHPAVPYDNETLQTTIDRSRRCLAQAMSFREHPGL